MRWLKLAALLTAGYIVGYAVAATHADQAPGAFRE